MVRHKNPDFKNALSLVESSKRQVEFTLSLPVSQEAGTTIIRNIYESFRMLGDAILVKKGIKTQDHLIQIKELLKLNVKTLRPIQLIDSLRIIRHNINYYGYRPSLEEINECISITKNCFFPLYKEVLKIIEIE